MKKYIQVARLDHWIKQLFIFPGLVVAYVLLNPKINIYIVCKIIFGFISTCLIASSNYIINEWLDAEFDKFHPTKKYRSVVENDLRPAIVYILYFGLAIIGVGIAFCLSPIFCGCEIWLWVMGILYNVKPILTKDIPIIDILSESINNAIRFLLGWFTITDSYLPPISIIIGYWFAGAFLMAMKRFAEYRMIANPDVAGEYRKSFQFYSEQSLLLLSFFFAMCSVLFIGIFLIKYRLELILFMPFFMGLFCYYFHISFNNDSAAQKPEKLFREKRLMFYCFILCILFWILMILDFPILNAIISDTLIKIK